MPALPHPPTTLFVLTGFMGSGKTQVGEALARELACPFIDLDREIEARERQTIPELFAQRGEAGFRKAERDATLAVLASIPPVAVLALGGGAMAQPEIAAAITSLSVVTIFLDAPAEELHRRCVDSLDAGHRPLLKDLSSFKKLYAERLPVYRQAQWQVDTSGRTVPEIAADIAGRVRDAERERQRNSS
jgi:shikimate kinase